MTGVLLAQGNRDNDFVKGADVGFLTGQEKRGVKFHDRQGKERECLELLKLYNKSCSNTLPQFESHQGGELL